MPESTRAWQDNFIPFFAQQRGPEGIGVPDGSARAAYLNRNPWLRAWIEAERAEAYQDGKAEGIVEGMRILHRADHPAVPEQFITALQSGAFSTTTVPVDGLTVTVTTSGHGTGTHAPDSADAWSRLCETVRAVASSGYCPDVIGPLPPQITTASWTNPQGRPVHVRTPAS